MWGTVLKRDLLGEVREEDRFHNKDEIREYLKSEIEKQGENVVIRNLDVSLIDDLSKLFVGINNRIKSLDLSGWKTSNVKDMSWMFFICDTIKSIDLSGWKTSNVENMKCLFYGCRNLKTINLSGWKTSNVENMSWMFSFCKGLKSLDLSGWDTSNVKNMKEMFYQCPAPYEVVDNKIIKK